MKKKIIFIVVIIFSFYNTAYAKTFYGEYRKVNKVSNYKEDELKIENYKLYNTYKKEYIDLGYMEENKDYIKDENDFIEEIVEVYEDEDRNENIEIVTSTPSSFQFIFYSVPSHTIINELEVYNKDIKDNYIVYNSHMLGNTINNMNDGDYDTLFKQIYDKKYISLVLKKRYDIENIKIIIYTEECNDIDIEVLVGGSRVPISLANDIKRKHIITFKYDETLVEDKVNYKNKITKKLYRHYKEKIIKLNNYVKSGDNILIEDYLEVTDLYVRNKLVLKDDLVITDKNTNVLDLIEYSTDKVNINCNIDYSINDVYSCNFMLNDINITKDIEVNIPKEEIKVIEESSENTKNVKQQKNVEEEINDNVNEEIVEEQVLNNSKETEISVNKENNISNLRNSNINRTITTTEKNKLNTTKRIIITNKVELKDNSKENVNKKKEKMILGLVKLVIFFNLIVIEIILFIKKRNRNNVERV